MTKDEVSAALAQGVLFTLRSAGGPVMLHKRWRGENGNRVLCYRDINKSASWTDPLGGRHEIWVDYIPGSDSHLYLVEECYCSRGYYDDRLKVPEVDRNGDRILVKPQRSDDPRPTRTQWQVADLWQVTEVRFETIKYDGRITEGDLPPELQKKDKKKSKKKKGVETPWKQDEL